MAPVTRRRRNRRTAADTFSETVAKYGLCPNRLWAVAGESLDQILPDGDLPAHKDHDACTFNFCEWSQKDFTTVEQRHECADANECESLLFPRAFLDKRVMQGKSLAWKLDGSSFIDWPDSYMAISHVWSDGTGAGAWPAGEVNECLYGFFRNVAIQYGCQGIWWDTICIPEAKVARNKALERMHHNYQDARITLVHDLFIRAWDWVDAETACFVILLSPWFSRGWTALELAMSRKVKIVFNGPQNHPVIKDLDEDILANETSLDEPQTRHQILSRMIRNLRTGIASLDDLLGLLGARYTSWPKDMYTIARLLVGVELESIDKQQPHDVQRNILKKLGKVSPGNLFHSGATIADGTSWCSTRLFDMPKSNAAPSLRVDDGMNLRGAWQPILIGEVLQRSSFLWQQTHPFVRNMLQERLKEEDCSMLAEVSENDDSMASDEYIERALLVRQSDEPDCYEYLGALYFHSKLPREEIADGEAREITILGGVDYQDSGDDANELNDPGDTQDVDQEPSQEEAESETALTVNNGDQIPPSQGWIDLHYAIWRGQVESAKSLIDEAQADLPTLGRLISARDRLGRQAIHLAAERGNLELVRYLHNAQQISSSDEAANLVDWAVVGGSVDVVGFLLNEGCKPANMGLSALDLIAKMGTAPLLPFFLDAVAQLDQSEGQGTSPLHIAAENHHTDVVAFFAEHLTDLDKIDKHGQTALHVATVSGSLPIVKILLNDANINLEGHSNRTPLQQALLFDRQKVARFLIQSGADIDFVVAPMGWTPLHLAAYHGDLDTAEALILGAPTLIDEKDSKVEWTPLHLAAMQGHANVVRLLLETQAHPHQKDIQGWTPGMMAMFKGHPKLVKMLGGESLNHPGKVESLSRWSDLHLAAMDGLNFIQLLRQDWTPKGPDADELAARAAAPVNPDSLTMNTLIEPTERQEEDSVIGYAAMKNHATLVKLMLEWGVNVNAKAPNGATCLHYAAQFKSIGLARHLLKKGAETQAKDPSGLTPLHWAAKAGARGIVDLLIKRGEDLNAQGLDANARAFSNGFKPLHYAAERNHIGVVDLLINAGADMMATASGGQTGLSMALEKGHASIVAMMIHHGADFRKMQVEGSSMLQLAVEYNRRNIVELLISHGASVRSSDMNGLTALHYAAWRGRTTIAAILIDKGADLEAMDHRGYTPLIVALEHRQHAMASYLQQRGAVNYSPHPPQFTTGGNVPVRQDMGNFDFDSELFAPVVSGNAELVKSLIKDGAKMDVADAKGRTLLHVAASHGQVYICQYLVEKKFRLTRHRFLMAKDDHDMTALVYAAAGGSNKMVQYLLSEMRNEDQGDLNQALKYAIVRDHVDVAETLMGGGADFRAHNADGMPAWYYAIYRGSVSMMQSLVRSGFNLEEVDGLGRAALHYAAWHGNINIARFLIENKVYPSRDDENKRSAIQYAGQYSNKPMYFFLVEMGVPDLMLAGHELLDRRAAQFQEEMNREE